MNTKQLINTLMPKDCFLHLLDTMIIHIKTVKRLHPTFKYFDIKANLLPSMGGAFVLLC